MRTRRVDVVSDDKVWFVIDGIASGSALERGAREMEFVEFDGGFGRAFPSSSWFIDEAYAGFSTFGPRMLEQHVAGGAVRWSAALNATIERANSVGVPLFVVGSCAMAVHGARVAPGDIDLVVSDEGARLLGQAMVDVLVEPVMPTNGWISRLFGRAFIEDCRVEWAGGVEDWVDGEGATDFGPTALARSVELDWGDHVVRVPPPDLLRDVNQRRGRHDRVAAIEAVLPER